MTKPVKPNIEFPQAFAIDGQKTDFLEDKIQDGFDPVDPDVLAGDNLNKFIDDTYKGLHYSIDGVSDLYKGAVLYDADETYSDKSLVFNIESDRVVLYKSLSDDNTGNPLTDTVNWQKVELGANKDLSNLSSVGEKHFLNKTQVTNCILEIPQRVKYELGDKTLTIKAGSILAVPYGTTDQSSSYPKGATFVNDNFKVVETFFTDGKFFVYAEVQSDIVNNTYMNEDIYFSGSICISLQTNNVSWNPNTYSGTDFSPVSQGQYYDIQTNTISYIENGAIKDYQTNMSFPILFTELHGTTSLIKQVFNGISRIGNAIWVDKGIKYLTGAGRNSDGSLKTVEHTTTSGTVFNFESNQPSNVVYIYNGTVSRCPSFEVYHTNGDPNINLPEGSSDNHQIWFDEQQNVVYYSPYQSIDWAQTTDLIILSTTYHTGTDGIMSSAKPELPLNLTNNNSTSAGGSDLVDFIYPVGSIYMSVNTTSPSVLFGGVWEQIQGRFLLASDANNPVGTTGGEATHTLTTAEMPSHTHSGSSVSAGAHTHSRGSMEFGGYFGLSGLDTYGNNYGNGVFSISAMSTGPANGHATNQANGFTNFQILGSRNWTGSTSSNGAHTHTINIGSTGSGSAHNNMPPYLAVNIWKRTA